MGIVWKSHRGLQIVFLLVFLSFPAGEAWAQSISPAQEEEFLDARRALEAAQKAGADKYASEPLEKARDLLVAAENALSFQDGVKFTQASRLARAHAELAKTIADLRMEERKLAAAQETLQRAREELARVKKSAL